MPLKEIIVDLELSSICNFSCKFCPKYGKDTNRKSKYLPMETVDLLVNHINSDNIIWFSGLGEPFLHPQFGEIVKKLKSTGSKVYTNTNAAAPRFKERLVSSIEDGLDFINVSLYGFNGESYKQATGQGSFLKVKENVEFLKEQDINLRLSYVVTPDTSQSIKEKLIEVYGVSHVRLIDCRGESLEKREQSIGSCDLYKFWLFINSDGNVLPCINDVNSECSLGADLAVISGKKENYFPKKICSYCNDPRKSIPYPQEYFQKVFGLGK